MFRNTNGFTQWVRFYSNFNGDINTGSSHLYRHHLWVVDECDRLTHLQHHSSANASAKYIVQNKEEN